METTTYHEKDFVVKRKKANKAYRVDDKVLFLKYIEGDELAVGKVISPYNHFYNQYTVTYFRSEEEEIIELWLYETEISSLIARKIV